MVAKYGGLLTTEDRACLAGLRREAFEMIAGSNSQCVHYLPYLNNDQDAEAWGAASPLFGPPVSVSAIVEFSITERNLTYWGDEELTRALVLLGKAEVDELGLHINRLGRIEFTTDGVTEIVAIEKIFRDRGMGHESWTLILRCVPVKDAGAYE